MSRFLLIHLELVERTILYSVPFGFRSSPVPDDFEFRQTYLKKDNRHCQVTFTATVFDLKYSTSSFRYPCLVTTYSLSLSLP